jgi:hypothetical protein
MAAAAVGYAQHPDPNGGDLTVRFPVCDEM